MISVVVTTLKSFVRSDQRESAPFFEKQIIRIGLVTWNWWHIYFDHVKNTAKYPLENLMMMTMTINANRNQNTMNRMCRPGWWANPAILFGIWIICMYILIIANGLVRRSKIPWASVTAGKTQTIARTFMSVRFVFIKKCFCFYLLKRNSFWHLRITQTNDLTLITHTKNDSGRNTLRAEARCVSLWWRRHSKTQVHLQMVPLRMKQMTVLLLLLVAAVCSFMEIDSWVRWRIICRNRFEIGLDSGFISISNFVSSLKPGYRLQYICRMNEQSKQPTVSYTPCVSVIEIVCVCLIWHKIEPTMAMR